MRSLKFLFTLLSFCFVSICFGQVVSNGDSFSVTVPVSNNGPATEYAAIVEFTIPEGAQYVSSNPTIGSYSESDSTWYIGLMSSGRSQSIKVNFEVTDLSQYPLVISASASGVANDADLTNNNFTDTIFKLTDILSGSAQSWGNASLRGTVLDNDSLCNPCSTKTYLVGGSTNNGTVVYFDELSGEYRFVFENPNEDASFSYDLVCYDCGDGVEHYQNTSVEVIPKLFTDSLFGGSSGTVYPDTFAQEVIVEEIDTTTKKIKIVMNTGDTLEAMFTDYRGTAGSGDDWGAQSVQSDSTLTGDGTSASPLSVVPSGSSIERITLSPTEEIINYGDFALHIENGVSTILEVDNDFLMSPSSGTVFYIGTTVGATGILEGVTYTSVDNTTLSAMDPATDDYTTVVTSLVTDMNGMFFLAESFNQDISSWDVSNVTSMSFMFRNAVAFNGNINNWDVSNVTDMNGMFFYAESFNKDLSGWCVTNIATEPTNFDTGATSWTLPKPIWGTCP